jgi:hypothetical protein
VLYRLSAAVLAGQPLIFIDNCSYPQWGAFLTTITWPPR